MIWVIQDLYFVVNSLSSWLGFSWAIQGPWAFLWCPRRDNDQVIKCYLSPNVCPSVRHTQRRPLFKSNSFDQNFMKLGHIV